MNNLENGGGWIIHTKKENHHLNAHLSRVLSFHFCPTHTHIHSLHNYTHIITSPSHYLVKDYQNPKINPPRLNSSFHMSKCYQPPMVKYGLKYSE